MTDRRALKLRRLGSSPTPADSVSGRGSSNPKEPDTAPNSQISPPATTREASGGRGQSLSNVGRTSPVVNVGGVANPENAVNQQSGFIGVGMAGNDSGLSEEEMDEIEMDADAEMQG